MIKFDHPNLLSILGISLDTDHEGGLPLIILPFMTNGDPRTYLKNKRQLSRNIDCLPEVCICTKLIANMICHLVLSIGS